MTLQKLTRGRRRARHLLCLPLTLGLALSSAVALAQRTAVGDDGREVLLHDNGTWEYKSTDRFATGADGTRVRLKDNGGWEVIGNAPVTREEQVTTSRLDAKLDKVVMEIFREKLIKSTRYDSRTVFYLDIEVSSYSEPVAAQLSHFNLFKVSDSRGKQYPVLGIAPQKKLLQPGDKLQLEVRVDGAPSGLLAVGTRYMTLHIDKAVFGTETELKFSKRVEDIIEVKRDTPFD
ncbi:hypothetical protein G8764_15035 [Pseudomaricurvus alcaniphilus]|uniref:hypothetical protein n=1 Tax=Pseudomaricurvus alcaniphilus TaxID=1166482 RepID=UPI00140BEE93|nr:hypothetical protein [Pseudomaricurvus alcaniphilus]NHN38622.1 hypothetical protein [Pseudomaricurvus alcaniphilus]